MEHGRDGAETPVMSATVVETTASKPFSRDELESKAKGALDIPELVALARAHSPSQTQKLAVSAGFPRRQAEAARSLAMLRRDFGLERFETYLTTMAQARTTSFATEQEQDNRRENKMDEKIKAALSRIADPIARFRLLVKHGLKTEAQATLLEMVERYWVSFLSWSSECFLREDKVKPDDVQVVIVFASPGTQFSRDELKLSIDLDRLLEFLEIHQDFVRPFLAKVFSKITKLPDSVFPFSSMTKACLKVSRHFFGVATGSHNTPEVDELERWVIATEMRTSDYYDMPCWVLPACDCVDRKNFSFKLNDLGRCMDPVVDRLAILGMSMSDIHQLFINALRVHIKTGLNYNLLVPLVGAKCFPMGDGHLQGLLRELRPSFWKALVRSQNAEMPEIYRYFWVRGMRDSLLYEEDGFLFARLVDLLASGELARTCQLVHLLEPFNGHDRAVRLLGGVIKRAAQIAELAGNFGIAAAITGHFPHSFPPGKALELTALALASEQVVAFRHPEAQYFAAGS